MTVAHLSVHSESQVTCMQTCFFSSLLTRRVHVRIRWLCWSLTGGTTLGGPITSKWKCGTCETETSPLSTITSLTDKDRERSAKKIFLVHGCLDRAFSVYKLTNPTSERSFVKSDDSLITYLALLLMVFADRYWHRDGRGLWCADAD